MPPTVTIAMMVHQSLNDSLPRDESTNIERRKNRKRRRTEYRTYFSPPHRLQLCCVLLLFWLIPTTISIELPPGNVEENIIYTKPSNQGIGLKLPTGYEQYRKAKRDYQLNHIQRTSSGNNNTHRINSKKSRQEQLLHRFREIFCTSPLKLLLRGMEGVARAAYETNEFALQGTTLHSHHKKPPPSSDKTHSKSSSPRVNTLHSQHVDAKKQSHRDKNTLLDSSFVPPIHKKDTPHNPIRIYKESDHTYDDEESLDPFTKDGARLLSASFRVLSNSVGLAADVIRISGETFAGAFGSSVKIIGSSFTSAANSLDRLAGIVSPDSSSSSSNSAADRKQQKQQEVDGVGGNRGLLYDSVSRTRKPLTSEKLFDRSVLVHGHSSRNDDKIYHENHRSKKPGLVDNTVKVAGKSMRLISSVVRGIGNSIVVAGAASESLTASTASVAEDTVRIFEEFAKSIADAFHVEGNIEKGATRPLNEFSTTDDATWETVEDWKQLKSSSSENTGSFVYYGTDDDESNSAAFDSDSSAHLSSPTVMELLSAGDSVFWTLFHFIREKALMEIYFATEATEGVSALATDLLGVLFICFISSILLLRQKRQETGNYRLQTVTSNSSSSKLIHQGSNGSFQSTTTTSSTIGAENMCILKASSENSLHLDHASRLRSTGLTVVYAVLRVIRKLLLLPIHGLSLIRRILMNRYLILFMIHFFGGWLLCNSSQIRSLEIQRKSEVLGYRSAIESLTSSHREFSLNESATWLNIILARLWRVPLFKGSMPTTEHPYFTKRTIPIKKDGFFIYDGLEPYVSSLIGSILKESWETPEQMPNEIAYVSLHSFTLGSHPPIIRGIEIHSIDDEQNSIYLRVALDLLLSDSSLIFDFRISSLDYALLPVTQIKISSIDVRLDLDIKLDLISRYPFLSMAKVSIAHLPVVSVQIVPLNEDSGLRGINLSSLPVISDWVQATIRRCLMQYLPPHYIAFDIERYWSHTNCKESGSSSK